MDPLIIIASIIGDKNLVAQLITAGANIECKDNGGNTPIIIASTNGHQEVVDLLIKAGANIECKNISGNTPIIIASIKGHQEVVDLLIKAGANIECKGNGGNTPIIFASINGHQEVVDLLIKAGANIECKDNDGNTPIIIASINGHQEVVDLLIKAGANIECKDNDGNTPIIFASINGHQEVVDLLIKAGANIECKGNGGNTPIIFASIIGHQEVVDLLIKAGANIECKGNGGNTPIIIASINGHQEVVDLLIKAGANIECKDNDGNTPIIIASINGHQEVVDLLIQAGADIECKDNGGNTPIIIASIKGHQEVVDLLIKAGANIEHTNNEGRTPFGCVSIEGHKEVVDLLIKAGANIECIDNGGNTPIIIASTNEHQEVVDLLIKAGANIECKDNDGHTPIIIASINGHQEVVDLLIKAGANIECKDNGGNTPIIITSINGHQEVVDLLIKAGANIECKDNRGNTPIIIASTEGHKDVVDLLVKADAIIEVSNYENDTPIVCAAKWGNVEIVDVLLKAGACSRSSSCGSILNTGATFGQRRVVEYLLRLEMSLEIRDLKGNTPLQNAIIKGHLSVVQLLIRSGADTSTSHPSSESIIYSAASCGHADIVKYLGSRGAQKLLDLPNASGWSPIAKAVSGGHFRTVRQLHQLGADMNCSVNGKGLLHLAAESGCLDIYQYLIIAGLDCKRPNIHGLKAYECFPFQSKLNYQASNRLGHSCEQSLSYVMSRLNEQYATPAYRYKLSELSGALGLGSVNIIEGGVSETIMRFVREKEVVKGSELCGSSAEGTKVQLPDEMDFLRLVHSNHLSRNEMVDNLHGYKYIQIRKIKNRFLSSKVLHEIESQTLESSAKAQESKKSGEIRLRAVAGGGGASVPMTIRWPDDKPSKRIVSDHIVTTLRVDDWPDDWQDDWSDNALQNGESESEVTADVCVYQRTGCILSQADVRRGLASVPVTIKRLENISSSLLISVDIVPIFHVDDWPDDAIKKTWKMDEDTLRKSGYRLVLKPPHKDSEYGRLLPEEDRERMLRISFSHLEPATIAPLDPRIKDAYITAKCLRSPMACGVVIKDTNGVIHFVSHFLTSYLLKTVFLHNIDDFLETNRSLPEMVYIIYSQLEDYLGKGNLPFYWQPSVNLLEGLKLNIAKSHQVAKLMKAIVGRMSRLERGDENHGDDAREDGPGIEAADDEPDIGCYIVELE
ncbi:ankyrin repeat domain-containing protein 50-like isoform X2 [Lineus longissimus]|uniref:ankyrin repeat domain-containing protein 50-like isoform X2 n=1 Tax=Lineus longissimus TaxID=88925 RepID=UPI00315CE2AC